MNRSYRYWVILLPLFCHSRASPRLAREESLIPASSHYKMTNCQVSGAAINPAMATTKNRFFAALGAAIALHLAALLGITHIPRPAHIAPPATPLIFVVVQPSRGSAAPSQIRQPRERLTAARQDTAPPRLHHALSKDRVATALADRVRSASRPPPLPSLGRPATTETAMVSRPSTAASDGDHLGSPDQVVYAPQPLARVLPDYPATARLDGIEGQVILRATIDPLGHVEDPIEIVRPIPALDQAAIAALRQWSFRPGRDRYGNPIRARIEVPIVFVLR